MTAARNLPDPTRVEDLRARLWRPQQEDGALPIAPFGLAEVIERDGLGRALAVAERDRGDEVEAFATF